MYYTEFDWLSDNAIEEVLPEDGLPSSLHIDDLDDEDDGPALTKSVFQDWIWEGRHDCDVAAAVLRMWVGALRGSGNDAIADFFVQLHGEYVDSLCEEERRVALEGKHLPVTFVAALLQRYGYVPFDTRHMTEQEVHDELCRRILEEIGSVQAYMSTWRSTTAVPEPERKTVDDTVLDVCSQVVQPWPQIDKEPVPMYEEGRFVKSFPLAFPMGVGDLKQPRLRDDFSTAEWVQHKFRHVDGRFFNASRGHRETWAMFNQIAVGCRACERVRVSQEHKCCTYDQEGYA